MKKREVERVLSPLKGACSHKKRRPKSADKTSNKKYIQRCENTSDAFNKSVTFNDQVSVKRIDES